MMLAVTIPAPPVDLEGDLVDFDEARFAEAWDGTMLAVLAALQAAFAQLAGDEGGRITIELPAGSSAVALAVREGLRLLARSAALGWRANGANGINGINGIE